MTPLSAFAHTLVMDHTYYINDNGTMMREYWASDGAGNNYGMIADLINEDRDNDALEMSYEDVREFVEDKHTQEQAMDLATQMMTRQYYQFLKANGRGLIDD